MGTIDNALWAVKKIGYKLWDKRGDIAFVAGMAGTAVGTYLFVKGSQKNVPVVEAYKKKKQEIAESNCTEEEKRKMTRDNAITAFKGSVRNYAAPVVVTSASYGLQIYSHIKLHSDLDKVSALANGLSATLALIQQRITEAEGEDKWREYAYGQKVKTTEVVDFETGEVSHENEIDLGDGYIEFSIPFNEITAGPESIYEKYKGANKTALLISQNCWNDKLNRHPNGFILLSSVWESIFGNLNKFPKEWSRAGWMPKRGTEPITIISFGLDSKDAATVAFMNDETPDVRLVFNCVPDVYAVM